MVAMDKPASDNGVPLDGGRNTARLADLLLEAGPPYDMLARHVRRMACTRAMVFRSLRQGLCFLKSGHIYKAASRLSFV